MRANTGMSQSRDEVHQHRDDGTKVRAPMTIWRRGGVLSVPCVLSLWTALAHGACTDPAAAATRAMAETQCPCATATSHREYVKCVAGVAKMAVASGSLPRQCRRAVLRCAAQSTCGRSGFVSCCRTSAKGVTKCSIKPDAAKCTAPRRGAACVQDVPSCCDACSAGSCPLSTTTTMAGGPTTTTTIAPQTHTVMVGQDGLNFIPARLTIHVGDTVRWVWATAGHSVVSGTDGNADNRFCSPDDTGCANPPLSNAGATYDHTFANTGSFPYYCSVHFSLGMTGTITVR